MPFKNLSEDEDNAYFASGMQDMILTKLLFAHAIAHAGKSSDDIRSEFFSGACRPPRSAGNCGRR